MKKKFIFVITFCLLNFLIFPKVQDDIFAQATYYGRALSSNIYLYSSPLIVDDNSNRIFEIPTTYFVKILKNENDLFYKAEYNSISGYIIKSEFSYVDSTPKNPFAENISFRVFTPSGVNLRSSPNETLGATNLITTIPFMETNLSFLGNCIGEEAISYKGNIWYYCKFIKNNQDLYGYVYSPFCDMLKTIPQNTENFTYTTVVFDSNNEPTKTKPDQFTSLAIGWQVTIIISVSLPCIGIIYLLFKPTKIAMQSPKNKVDGKPIGKKKKISRLKNNDYYEIDNNYFN